MTVLCHNIHTMFRETRSRNRPN